MKLRLGGLGKIKEAELNIKPLTIFVGPNGTNKTWAAYAFYGLVGQLSRFPRRVIGNRNTIGTVASRKLKQGIRDITASLIETLKGVNAPASFDTSIFRKDVIDSLPQRLRISLGAQDLGKLMATDPKVFDNAEVHLDVTKDELTTPERFLDSSVAIRFSKEYAAVFTQGNPAAFSPEVNAVFPRTLAGKNLSLDGPLADSIERALTSLALVSFNNVMPIPAERKALVLFYKSVSRRQSRLLQRTLSGIPALETLEPKSRRAITEVLQQSLLEEVRLNLPQPITDFAEFLTYAEEIETPPEDSTLFLFGNIEQRDNDLFTNLVQHLDKDILRGTLGFEQEKGKSRLYYSIGAGTSLGIHIASSLVRSLTGLDIYLKHLAQPGDILIIDEPEMNAHPEAQLKIAEMLAYLVNSGINVFITTHSPYIVDHIGNLIEASKLSKDRQENIAHHFMLKTQNVFLSPEQVGTYLFTEEGLVRDISGGSNAPIDLSTFSNPSDYLSNLFARILEAERKD